MLLALDVGNTNVTVGVFAGSRLLRTFRLQTHPLRTADEYGLWLLRLLRAAGLDPGAVQAAAMASVVPPLTPVLAAMCRRHFGVEALAIHSGLRALPASRYEVPEALGADRLANAVAGWVRYGGGDKTGAGRPGRRPVLVVDCGTATKVEAVSAAGEYLGGAIAPGLGTSAQALYEAAARLPRVELARPPAVLGRNNVAAMQAGLVLGFAGLVEGLVARALAEVGGGAAVVATGGLAPLVAEECPSIQVLDPDLTLEGVRLIWEWNRGGGAP